MVVPGSRGQLGMLFTNVDKELIKQLRMPICLCSFFRGNVVAIGGNCYSLHRTASLNFFVGGATACHLSRSGACNSTNNQMVCLFTNALVQFIRYLFLSWVARTPTSCFLKNPPTLPFCKGFLSVEILDTVSGVVHLQ